MVPHKIDTVWTLVITAEVEITASEEHANAKILWHQLGKCPKEARSPDFVIKPQQRIYHYRTEILQTFLFLKKPPNQQTDH